MSAAGKNGAMVYGIVMYDFQAERADELEAKAGEAIIVIAQSNPEWFVAKPIGRLGGPGLIPVSFIEIRDMATNTPVPNPQDAIRRAGIPRVEEWKKMAAEYKNSSITLGKFEAGGPQGQQQAMEQGMERMSLQQGAGRMSQGNVQQPQSNVSPETVRLHRSNVVANHAANFSETHRANNPQWLNPRPQAPGHSYTLLSPHASLATALPKTNTGL